MVRERQTAASKVTMQDEANLSFPVERTVLCGITNLVVTSWVMSTFVPVYPSRNTKVGK